MEESLSESESEQNNEELNSQDEFEHIEVEAIDCDYETARKQATQKMIRSKRM